jgi:hypothetical protein
LPKFHEPLGCRHSVGIFISGILEVSFHAG